jgi:hypothetical protein
MGKIVRYVFVGDRTAYAAQLLALAISIIVFPLIAIAVLLGMFVYLLLTVVKIEEEIDRPTEFIEGLKEGRFSK